MWSFGCSEVCMCALPQMVEKYLWTLHGCKPHPPSEEECRAERQRLVSFKAICIVLLATTCRGMSTAFCVRCAGHWLTAVNAACLDPQRNTCLMDQ